MISTFQYSTHVELAISKLENKGIPESRILAVPVFKVAEEKRLFDTINHTDGISTFDGIAVSGTVFMVLGVIYGYVLKWGPIIWGLIGLFAGGILGFLLDRLPIAGKSKRKKNMAGKSEVVIIVKCNENESKMVEDILRDNLALGIGKLNDQKEGEKPSSI